MQRQQSIPEELTPDEEAIIGDPILDLNDEEAREEFFGGREFDHVERYSVEWGTYTFEAATAISTDGDTYTRVEPHTAPREKPPSAEVLLRDLLARGGRDALVAVSLAAGWGVDLDKLEAADALREEVRA